MFTQCPLLKIQFLLPHACVHTKQGAKAKPRLVSAYFQQLALHIYAYAQGQAVLRMNHHPQIVT